MLADGRSAIEAFMRRLFARAPAAPVMAQMIDTYGLLVGTPRPSLKTLPT
jgi:hypothetical protein